MGECPGAEGGLISSKYSTVLIRFKVTLLNNYEARGRHFWRLNNYVEVIVSHIYRVASNWRLATSLEAAYF